MTTQTNGRPQNEALAVRPLTAEVRSETDPAKAYTVTLPYCPCKDFFYRRGNLSDWACKHLKAAMGLVGAPSRDTSRLDEATARELLLDLKVSITAANGALARSRRHPQGTITMGEDVIVIVYDRHGDFYDLRLPA
jgi:choline dehydrogenase-like flavoprotein